MRSMPRCPAMNIAPTRSRRTPPPSSPATATDVRDERISPQTDAASFRDHSIVRLMRAADFAPSPPPPPSPPESPEAPRRRTPWGHPCPPRDCPAASHSGATRDAPRAARPGTGWGRAESAARQVFRIPDLQVPTQPPRAALTPHECDRMAPRESGDLETWESGELPRTPPHALSGRSTGTNDLKRTLDGASSPAPAAASFRPVPARSGAIVNLPVLQRDARCPPGKLDLMQTQEMMQRWTDARA